MFRPILFQITIGLVLISFSAVLLIDVNLRSPHKILPVPPIPTPLRTKLEYQENVYDRTVQARHALIRKYGPKPEKLRTFPSPQSRVPYQLWDFFPATFNCPHETERIGTLGDGGKWVCGLSKLKNKQDCVVYSAGISRESSFEAEVVRRTQCTVYGFDWSVNKFGPEVHHYASVRNQTRFQRCGLAGTDKHDANPPMWTLQALMQKHGHTFVDILKIDIERSEFDTLSSIIKLYRDIGPLPFGQLQLEVHADRISFVDFLRWWEDLEEAGLRPFWTEPNLLYSSWTGSPPAYAEYSFLNIGLDHEVLRG